MKANNNAGLDHAGFLPLPHPMGERAGERMSPIVGLPVPQSSSTHDIEALSLLSRRAMLQRVSTGFGWLAFAGLFGRSGADAPSSNNPRPALPAPHFPPKAKSVIFLFMDGGPSQVDTFDPKPRLRAENGKPFPLRPDATQFDSIGKTLASPWEFTPRGQSGLPISELFPHLGGCADDLCVIRSMTSQFPEHAQACYFLHTGSGVQGRPSIGAWASYGLGTASANLPGFVVLNGGSIPLGGLANWASGFLPPLHEATQFNLVNGPVLENLASSGPAAARANLLGIVAANDRAFASQLGPQAAAVESAIRNGELAAAMQTAVPDATDLRGESEATLKLYGVDSADPLKARYARECLLARRLVERGVRFIEVGAVSGIRYVSPWDSHGNMKKDHGRNAFVVDQPIAALLTDLKARGLLDETLVLWAGEFGRTPFAQGSDGRDHNPQGFTIWLAGGGIRGGMSYGATDEFGYRAVENVVKMHDLHATMLHLLGIDHERLTFLHGGRFHRLTDVHGRVIREVLA